MANSACKNAESENQSDLDKPAINKLSESSCIDSGQFPASLEAIEHEIGDQKAASQERKVDQQPTAEKTILK